MKALTKFLCVIAIIAISYMDLKIIVDYKIVKPAEKYGVVQEKKTVARVLDLSKNQPEEVFGPSFEEEEISQEELEKEVQRIIEQTKLEAEKENMASSETIEIEDDIQEDYEEPVEEVQEEIQEEPEPEIEPEPESEPINYGAAGDVVSTALEYVGWDYVSGGSSPETGFDCSGFTKYIYGLYGIELNRVSGDQAYNGTPVEREDLQPGDLLLFSYYGSENIGHSGIYIGDGQMVHAANSSRGVTIDTIESGYYNNNYVTARRLY